MNIINISKRTNYSSSNRAKIPLALIVFTLSIITLVSFNNSVFATGVPYSITYDDNVVSNMPVDANDKTLNSTVSISSSTPTLSGKKFLGWCNSVPTTTDGIDSCSGTAYQPSSNLSIDQTGTGNNFHFYAMWQEQTYLQNLSADECTTTMSTAIDSRDGTEYHIQRLADGKCWLLDNLALDLTNSTVLNGMNESNTHASNTTLNYLKGTTTRNPSTDPNGQYATAAVSNWGSSNSYSAPLANLTNKDVIPTDATSTAGQYKVGGYYNWCAATAGSYCYGNGTSSSGTSSGNATEDICPKGWRMPTGNTSGEYSALADEIYGSTGPISDATASANYSSTLRLPLSGHFDRGSAVNQGSLGAFWSSTRYSNNRMYRLRLDDDSVNPADYNYRYYGYSVRCVLGS